MQALNENVLSENVLSEQEVKQNVQHIMEEVRQAAVSAGRNPDDVQVMAVTKTVDPVLVNAAIEQGITLLGENKAQELCSKYDSYHKEGVSIHFIGHLQTNKVKQIVDKVCMIESVDSIKLAKEIDKHCAAIDKVMDVLIEVNIGSRPSGSRTPRGNRPAAARRRCTAASLRPAGCEPHQTGCRLWPCRW